MSETEAPAQREITKPSPLLDDSGALVQTGWARQPLLDCNMENARTVGIRPLQRFRAKRWDYYGVTSPDGYFSITLADLGYAGLVFVYYVDFAKASFHEESITVPFGRGIKLARNSDLGECSYSSKRVQVEFTVNEGARHVKLRWDQFRGVPLHADLHFALPPDHESTVIVTPIRGRRFYYNRKINAMPVEGTLQIGDEVTAMHPESSLGNLDWGRGVWEYDSFWVWASASGRLGDGRRAGLNMGHGFGDTSAATENTLLLDGRIHKLGNVAIDYTASDFMQPWQMRSDRVDLEFTPFVERVAETKLVVIQSEVHQMFGRYAGSVLADDGETVRIDGIVGWAEEHHARW
ncbi:MAG: DUF2804 domain-containing protein [Deltaproteobacteria bacterium]|nr:DUF2804 domain-containing protein [Deltaproteobacteria bacterium]